MDDLSHKLAANRSMPASTVIPVLAYEDVRRAVEWLCTVFGFRERLRIGNHRSQLLVGEGAVVISERGAGQNFNGSSHSLLVRVEDVDSHYERARAHSARIVQPPTGYPYGERQYTVEDLGGHSWTFSQTLADIEPEEWGGSLV
ncbi:VOC family protein [Ktedonospora formicarum]|uniref:Glyoxalase n=1 Tax=Ktedonospora formicarum TaxID=2778364 RepID=A0A8J3I5B1_9CHLR|nr:VOC family protein [Ktedonospora formicarum]GHO45649.1 glyoxalase [Ktedonospora formicarum]